VEAGDVRLGGEEEERGAAAAEQLERERSLGVDPHRFHACTGEGRELPDDRLDLTRAERHAENLGATKSSGRPEAAAALRDEARRRYFLAVFFAAFFFVVVFFAAGFFVVFFAGIVFPPRNVHSMSLYVVSGQSRMDKLSGG
jgi:hypothetical protein